MGSVTVDCRMIAGGGMDDVAAFDEEHVVLQTECPKMEFVQRVFSESAFGDETSTSGIRCKALSKLRLR